jgi:hypothetical protein
MSSSINTSIRLNRIQNHPDFELEPIEQQPIIFKKGLFSKTLDPPKDNPDLLENYRTITVKCLYLNCS